MKRLILAALIALAVAAPASANVNRPKPTVWSSNTFVSPSGNIHCRYHPTIRVVSCTTLNTGLTVILFRWGQGSGSYSNLNEGGGPTLTYGTFWTAPGFRCDSYSAGMQCRSSSGHGFFVNRTNWNVW